MANYRPIGLVVGAASMSAGNGGVVLHNLSTGLWNLAFLGGTARYSTGNLVSGTVLGWSGTTSGGIGSAKYRTYTDGAGKYGFTIPTGRSITIKFYAKGSIS